jgi:alginate O-acetyltransferase complex protein AlgI
VDVGVLDPCCSIAASSWSASCRPHLTPLLLASILINWIAARLYWETQNPHVVTAAIVLDLAVLASFKYLDFLLGIAGSALGVPPAVVGLALPLGISFFTFHHVMYLTDLRDGKAPLFDPLRYGLY